MVAFIVIGLVLFLAIVTALVCIGASGSDAHIDHVYPRSPAERDENAAIMRGLGK
jgi:hypothetical protein